MNVALSEKDRKFREFALEGSMWKVIWKVCYPLAIYQSLNQLFKILDTMMAAAHQCKCSVNGRISVTDQHGDFCSGRWTCGWSEH